MRALVIALALAGAPLAAQQTGVSDETGRAAWDRIFGVLSHPRCSNCHVAGDQPMWAGLGYGPDAPHGMNIRADGSRIGAESIPCRTCHVSSGAANNTPHAPPHIADAWRLPPPEMAWLGKSGFGVCQQLRNPGTNDGNDVAGLVDHVGGSEFVRWGFTPGAGRSAPEGSIAQLARDLALWGAAGSPCE
jgi:hypothetical protein